MCLYNLRESPFFQDTLRVGESARYPLELFVGRERELDRLLRVIGSSPSSRQAIAGPAGVGKTTLAQRAKGEASAAGYLSRSEARSLASELTTDGLLIRLLSYVCEALVAAAGQVLVAGFVHALGKHRVTGALRAAGSSAAKHYGTYYRFFSKAQWSVDRLGLLPLGLVMKIESQASVAGRASAVSGSRSPETGRRRMPISSAVRETRPGGQRGRAATNA